MKRVFVLNTCYELKICQVSLVLQALFYTLHRKAVVKRRLSDKAIIIFLLLEGLKLSKLGEKMAENKQTYKNPQAGQPLISNISSGCRTPILEVKFCNLLKAFYYPNSPTVPRYSVTCVVDPEEHPEFLKGIQTIERNEKVDSIIKNETAKENDITVTTGKVLIKFQSKDIIPVYLGDKEYSKSDGPPTIELEDELAKGERIMIIYDILRYTKKNTMKTEHGLSFKPSCIYYFPQR